MGRWDWVKKLLGKKLQVNQKNELVLYVFCGCAVYLFGWLSAGALSNSYQFSETAVGALIGGFIAGAFGVVAALLSINNYSAEAKRERQLDHEAIELKSKEKNEVIIHSIVTKLIDLHDGLLKNGRHFKICDSSTRVFFWGRIAKA